MNAPLGRSTAAFDVKIAPDLWEQTGPKDNPRSRLLATGIINGQHFHIEAYQVCDNGGIQTRADATFDREWQAICDLDYDCGARTTQKIGRREYVIIASPYGD